MKVEVTLGPLLHGLCDGTMYGMVRYGDPKGGIDWEIFMPSKTASYTYKWADASE